MCLSRNILTNKCIYIIIDSITNIELNLKYIGRLKTNQIKEYNETTFESIKHINEYGNEYWYARELQTVLNYKEWRKFENVINKAKDACQNSDINVLDHFVGVDKMVDIGSAAKRKQKDYKLTRYACYLIVQNADPRKENVALGQTTLLFKQESKNETNSK